MAAGLLHSRFQNPALTELWRPSLDLALHRNRLHPGVRLVQLATVRPDRRPAIRTVVFRGFLDDACRLIFTTDVRSAKRAEIEAHPGGELCWYFPQTREQFRLSGNLDVIDSTVRSLELQRRRAEVWAELSEETQASFTWPPPGEIRDPSVPFPSVPPDPKNPVETFALLILAPMEVDHLELQGSPQHRWRYVVDAQGRWSGREINP